MKTKVSLSYQWIISLTLVIIVSLLCYLVSPIIGYKVVALILLLTVSILAMFFEILPVMFSALLSACIWNFFFIPPLFTFHIYTAEDLLMFLMYFVIAIINAVLTIKIREQENKAREKEEQEKSIKLYNTLLSSLSHELKTPISTILAGVDTLKENDDKLNHQHKKELLIEIEKASIRLNRQVENLLNMSRIENGMLKLNKDWIDINELIFSSIEHLKEKTEHKIIFIPHEELPLIKIDAGIFEQIIHNILYNATLYSENYSTVLIELSIENKELKLIISDEGPGIPEEHLSRIFEKFYRIDNSKTGGTGLGLYIVKGFVDAHNGNINIANRTKKGCSVHINIPIETSYIKNIKNE
jgi:two-component system sensor histidine kinase KdpD